MHPATTLLRSPVVPFVIAATTACANPDSSVGVAPIGVSASRGAEVAATAELFVTGLPSAFGSIIGSAVGPGGALFVTDPTNGRILRVDPKTGAVTTFASGLPPSLIGGVTDVAFIGETAYALVTLVGPDVGGTDVVGIYRIDGPASFTIIADVGAFALANPPKTDFFVPTGVQYALQPFRGGFLVTDGHHNRVLRVTLDGNVSEVLALGDVVPTGLAVSGNTVYVAEAGPLPHLPADGRLIAFTPESTSPALVAAGFRLLVDVEFGRGRTLFALSNGVWDGVEPGEPALPNTGALARVNGDGTFTTVVDGLDRPTALEIIGNTAYVFTLGGEIWRVDNVAGPPFGKQHL